MSDRIVFAARRVPVPADSGAPIRTHRLLRGLAEEFAVTLVAPQHRPGSADGPADLAAAREQLPGVEIVTVPGLGPSKRLRQLAGLAGSRSWEFGRYASPAFRRAVQQAGRRAALVHYDDIGAGLTGPVPGAVNSFAPHNIEHRILEGAAAVDRGLRRAFARRDARRLRAEELALWRGSQLVVAVSEAEAAAMRAAGAARVLVVPNGTDPAARLPVPALAAGEPLRLLFVGASDYRPNRVGLEWLLDEVLPRLAGRLPTHLDVVGRPPVGLPPRDGVTIHGPVPSVEPFYARAHAAVVPVPYGSGTRLKVVEAMARGVPVVSTPVGAEGLGVHPGQEYLGATDAAGFAAAIAEVAARLGGEGPPLEPLLAAARAVAEPLFWPRLAARLVAGYRDAIAA